MSHHVHATKRQGSVSLRRAPYLTRRLRYFPFRPQRLLDFAERQAIHHILSGEPAFARDADSEPQILKTHCAVSIWIDYTFNALLFGQRPPAPIEIESLRRSVDFD